MYKEKLRKWVWLHQDLISVHLPRGNHREEGTRLLSEMCTNRTRDKSEKLHPEKFQLCIRKQKFKVRVVKYWNAFPEWLWTLHTWRYN